MALAEKKEEKMAEVKKPEIRYIITPRYRGWTEEGIPSKEKLVQLGLHNE